MRILYPSSSRLRVLFFGNDEFSRESLRALRYSDSRLIEKLEIVTNKHSKKSPCKVFAEEHNIKINYWPYKVEKNAFDVGVVVSFGHLIPKSTIESFKWGMLNVHGSLLPRWRGPAPVIHSILAGDEQTGVTVMQIKPNKFDIGDIMMQKSCAIYNDIQTPELTRKLSSMGSALLIECLENLEVAIQNRKKQDPSLVTLAPKPTSEMGKINWSEITVNQLNLRFQALQHLVKLYTFWNNMKLYLLELDHTLNSSMPTLKKDSKPGHIFYQKKHNCVLIRCSDGWVGFRFIKISGRSTMSALDFHNGFLSKHQEIVCLCE
ncbi:Methionyl-tRNA formyltransferase, mitochondrial [Nymphon striatum]|nr:Methionyl-tRNA formyltransferase, mitochondrial [Nymphon striatum]